MINIADLADPQKRKFLEAFFKTWLGQLGVPANRVNINPLCGNGDFDVTLGSPGASTFFFDIGNVSLGGVTQPNVSGSSFYYGNLFLVTYIVQNTGTSVEYQVHLTTGPNSNLTSWLVRKRSPFSTGVDDDVNTFSGNIYAPAVTPIRMPFVSSYNGMLFNYIRQVATQVGAGASIVRTEWMFNGIRLDYTK